MFSAFKILVTCLIISSRCTCIPIPNGETTTTRETTTTHETTPRETTLTFKEKVEEELEPLKDDLKKIIDPLTNNEEKIERKGQIQGQIKKIIERAVVAETKNEVLLRKEGQLLQQKCHIKKIIERAVVAETKNEVLLRKEGQLLQQKDKIESLEDKIRSLEQQIQRITIPLSVRNKATKIENKHPEIKGTIPPEILKNLKPFEKPIIQRQYQWMELLNCNDDLYIKKLQADLNLAYLNKKSNYIEDTYEHFKLNFCYAIATVVEEVNKNIAHYEFEGMEQDFDLGISDPVITPYVSVFYNSVICSKKENNYF